MGSNTGMNRSWCLVVAAILMAFCVSVHGQDEAKQLAAVEEVAKGNSLFTNALYKVLKESNPDNLIFSPFSLSAVLAMLKPGARGTTATEIQTGLRFPADDQTLFKGYSALLESLKSNENFTLEAANRVYAKSGFDLNPTYVQIVQENFHAAIEQVDFSDSAQAASKINTWVEQITRDKIKDLIEPSDLSDLTRLVLVNAIYFKGQWKNKFNVKATQKAPFYLSAKDDDSVQVDMMGMDAEFPYADVPELGAKAVALPYQGDRLSMIVLLPNARDGLAEMEGKLENFNLNDLVNKLQSTKLQLRLPKFKLESTIDLKDPLTKLGVSSMFNPQTADFTGIPKVVKDGEGLYVSKAVQKAFIEVNEEGSEAAAATGVQVTLKSAFLGKAFRANHPFIGYIYDNESKTTLFSTLVTNPTMAKSEIKSSMTSAHGGNNNSGNTQMISTICATAAMFLLALAL